MRSAFRSLLLAALCSTACVPPRTVSDLGTAPGLGLVVEPAKDGRQFEVTLARPAYLVAVEVTVNQGARLVAASTGTNPATPGRHAFNLQSGTVTMTAVALSAEPTAAGPVEPCPVQPFYQEVPSGDSTKVVFNSSMPTQPQTAPLMCNTSASHPLTALQAAPPDRYVLVIASGKRIGIGRAGAWLADERAIGGVREVLDRIAQGLTESGSAWSATAYRLF